MPRSPRPEKPRSTAVLLRPYTAASLSERIVEARRRKAELADLLDALAQGQESRAIDLCLVRWNRGQSYANYCARVATELMLKNGDTRGRAGAVQ